MSSEYSRAAQLLHRLHPGLRLDAPVYDSRSIYEGVFVPQYNLTSHDYINHIATNDDNPTLLTANSQNVTEGIHLLLQSALKNHSPAHLLLAECFMYGNSVPVDYKRALTHYTAAAEISGDPHAYFMLGHAAATGLFGEVPVDPRMAILYYELAAKAGSSAASLALAYRYSHGIDVPHDCHVALHHYSRIAQLASTPDFSQLDNAVSYNIRLQDFSGGFYNSLSEVPSSVLSKAKQYDDRIREIEENALQLEDHQCMRLFTKALLFSLGDLFVPRNNTLAFEYAKECVDAGELRYANTPVNKNLHGYTDRDILVQCELLLGNMYLRGQGTSKNLDLAKHYLEKSLSLGLEFASALNGYGQLYEQQNNVTQALQFYSQAANTSSYAAMVNLVKLLTKRNVLGSPETPELFDQIRQAIYAGSTEALALYAEYIQAGFVDTSQHLPHSVCSSINVYYKEYIERFEDQFFSILSFAFDEVVHGNYKNALLAYLIAAEQGLANAQVSAAHLLYQVDPLFTFQPSKTFSDARVKLAITYLERALDQNIGDATVFLGDIHYNGVPGTNVLVNYDQAFKYYKRAAQRHSAMGSYNLARMYEYGLGPLNNSADYFMAKRYYDFSADYSASSTNRMAISYALLRLRLKYLFNKPNEAEQTSWFGALKNVKNRLLEDAEDNQVARLQQQHNGNPSIGSVDEGYDVAEMVILAFTTIFFVSIFVRNLLRHIRNRNRDPNEVNRNHQNDDGAIRFNVQRPNFEFHFFAI